MGAIQVGVELRFQGSDPAAVLVEEASNEGAGHVIRHLLAAGAGKS